MVRRLRTLPCLRRPARSGSRPGSPGSGAPHRGARPGGCRTASSRGAARRLPDLPRQSPLWWAGRLHAPPDPRAASPSATPSRSSPARPGRSSIRGWGSPPCPASTSTATPTPFGSRTLASSPPERTGGVRHHVHRRLRGAPGLLAASPAPPGRAPRRLRPRARQPVPGHRHARHDRGRVAAAHHAAPPDHRGPPARPVAHHEPLAELHHPPLVRVPRHAGACGAAAPRDGHRVAVLAERHRGPDGGRPRSG